MKKLTKVTKMFLLATATFSVVACSNDEATDNGPVAARFTADIGAPLTRAVGSNWNADHIGITVTNSNSDMKYMYKNVGYETSSTGATADFTPIDDAIFFQDKDEIVTFSAYAPYQESSAASALPGTNGVISVDTKDYNGNNPDKSQEDIDFLFASGATASAKNPTVTFADNTTNGGEDCSFHHKMAQLNIVLRTSTTDGFAADKIFDGNNTFSLGGLKHEGTFDVTTGEAAATGTEVDGWNITECKNVDDKTANTRTYSLILLPQDLTKALNLGIAIDGILYTNNDKINPNLEAGKAYTYTITVKKTGLAVSGCTITDWGNGGGNTGNATMQ